VALADILGVPIEDMTERDPSSINSLRSQARREAEEYGQALLEIATLVASVKSDDLINFREKVAAYDKAAQFSEDEADRNDRAADFYWPLLSFPGLADFAQAWRELLQDERAVAVFHYVSWDKDEFDAARRFF
jgi:hypothetical protein